MIRILKILLLCVWLATCLAQTPKRSSKIAKALLQKGKEIEVLKPEKPKGFWDLRVYKASRNQLLLTKAQLLKSLSPGYIDFDRSKKDLHLPADC